MHVLPSLLKCIAFVGSRNPESGEFTARATAILTARPGQNYRNYFVTARHTLDKMRNKGAQSVWIRVDPFHGPSQWVETALESWNYHHDPSVDVAFLELGPGLHMDQLMYPMDRSLNFPGQRNPPKIFPGDDLFIVGLFEPHQGAERKLPIVRIGNVAAVPPDPIMTSGGEVRGILIEARSMGGLSGSPVFVHVRGARPDGSQRNSGPADILMGIIHGHYDTRKIDNESSGQKEGKMQIDQINMGIAIVTPFDSVVMAIDRHEIQKPPSMATIIRRQ